MLIQEETVFEPFVIRIDRKRIYTLGSIKEIVHLELGIREKGPILESIGLIDVYVDDSFVISVLLSWKNCIIYTYYKAQMTHKFYDVLIKLIRASLHDSDLYSAVYGNKL